MKFVSSSDSKILVKKVLRFVRQAWCRNEISCENQNYRVEETPCIFQFLPDRSSCGVKGC